MCYLSNWLVPFTHVQCIHTFSHIALAPLCDTVVLKYLICSLVEGAMCVIV